MVIIPSASYWVGVPGNLGDVINAANNFSVALQSSGNLVAPIQSITEDGYATTYDQASEQISITGDGRRYLYSPKNLLAALRREISRGIANIARDDDPNGEAESKGINEGMFNLVALENNGVLTRTSAEKLGDILKGRISQWHRFTHPSPRPRSELTKTFRNQARAAVEVLVSAPIVGALMAVGNTGISIVRLPGLTAEAYKVLYCMPSIGPNLKTLAGAVLPFTVALTPPLMAIGSLGWGIVEGAISAPEYGVTRAVRRGFKNIDSTWDYSGELGITAVEEGLLKPLPKGKEPFDIKALEAGRGFAAGVIGAAAVTPILSAMMVYRVPKMAMRMLDKIWEKESLFFPLQLAYSILLLPGAAVLLGLAPLGGAVIGLVEGTRGGYKSGFKEAYQNIRKVLKDIWESTGDFV